MKIILKSEKDTIKFGEYLSKILPIPSCLALNGDLGSGKTVLCKSIVSSVTGTDYVPSPTFNLVNEYEFGKNRIFHFDFYRLENANELYNIGYYDYISNKRAIVLIEWADKFPDELPENHIKIDFFKNHDERTLEISSPCDEYHVFFEKLSNICKN